MPLEVRSSRVDSLFHDLSMQQEMLSQEVRSYICMQLTFNMPNIFTESSSPLIFIHEVLTMAKNSVRDTHMDNKSTLLLESPA